MALLLALLLAAPAFTEVDGILSQSTGPAAGSAALSLSWTAGGANARGFGMTWSAEQGRFLPAVMLRRALLDDVSLGLRFRPIGGEDAGSEIDADILVRKAIGRFLLLANAAIGKGVGARSDVDFEAAAFAGWTATPSVRFGLEARFQRELVDVLQTADDVGRTFDVTAGPSLSFVHGPLELRALAGVRQPRGTGPAGAAVVASGGLDF